MRFHTFHLIFFLTSLLAIAAFAQNEEVPLIPAPLPPVVVAEPAPVADNLGDTLIVEAIEQLKLSGNDLAALYRKYTGRRVIVASSAAQAEFEFIQPASPQDPLTYSEAAELLKKAATIENFVFVPDFTDPNLDILTLATAGLKPTARGVAVYSENAPLPEGDAVISYVMTFKHIKPDEAVRTFTQIIGQFGAFGSIAAVPNAAAVVITENTSLIHRLKRLKDEIDKPSSEIDTRFISVKFADVTELAATLNELMGQSQGSGRTAGIQRAPQDDLSAAVEIPQGSGATSSGEDFPVKIVPDPRTNRIFAMGRPGDLAYLEKLIKDFDIQSDQRNFLRRKLKFLAVADFLPIAGDALTRAFSGTGIGAAGTDMQALSSVGNANRQQSNASLSNGGANQNSTFAGNSGISGGGTSSTRGNALSDPQINSAPESLLIGRTLLVADNITNSIVVQGPPSGVEIIEKLLEQVDVRADQVMISTVFGQLSLGDTTSTGVDWLRAFRGSDRGGIGGSIIGGGPNSPVNSLDPTGLINPFTGAAAGAFANRSGLSLYGKIGDSLAAYVNLLSTDTNFTILSRPSIFTANNQKGTISSGRRIAVPTSSNQFNSSFSTNIEYRDVVLKLEVIPLVNSPDEITLQIALVSDDVIGSTPITGVGDVPIIGTRELLTTVTVPNNQTIILGGLITTNDTESVTGIPILSDIPGIGRLFSTKTQGVSRDELMIFIQPSIVNGSNSLDYVQADMDSRYMVADDARGIADGSVLPPLDPIFEKGASVTRTNTRMDGELPVEVSKKRRSLRPTHRR